MNKYLFWFDSEGTSGWTFEIEARNSIEAYAKAYNAYGPQVEGMIYKQIKEPAATEAAQ